MNPRNLASLMAEIEAGDPLDMSELSIDERDARELMASHFCEIDRRLARHGLKPEARLEMMAAIAAHTMVENMLLHMGRLQRSDGEGLDTFRSWMRRHGMSS